ncbi:DNA binding protein [Microbacterium phage Barnstormer]|uniref:DNA binding protein n=1 Tax=Microbacterium phage Barnstormer TaxID=3028491 RepID=A0AAE9ZN76_9CAUD|nr:DNA binding protein [Microbacterium phage Barnstormer]WDS52155.1 DNA binding protein [Microbacterium phage UtzChips]
MNATTIAVVFDAKLIPAAPLELEQELALITAAQGGDSDAYVSLLRQYAHGLRGLAKSEYARAGGTVDADETRANVLLAFAEALAACDGTTRIAAKLKASAYEVAEAHHLVGNFTIPARTRQRYFQAHREAGPDGDVEAKAVELGMSREVFRELREAFRVNSMDAMIDAHRSTMGRKRGLAEGTASDSEPDTFGSIYVERGYATVDQAETVARAFDAVDELTEGVIRDAYGFTEYDPIPDAEIAHRRGYSRSKVQRIRTEGIATMRAALIGDDEAEEVTE